MPGMMDTVLNLGLNDAIVEGLAKQVRLRCAYPVFCVQPGSSVPILQLAALSDAGPRSP